MVTLGVYVQGGLGDHLIQLNVVRMFLEHLRTLYISEDISTDFILGQHSSLDFLRMVPFIDNVLVDVELEKELSLGGGDYLKSVTHSYDIFVILKYVGKIIASGEYSFLSSDQDPVWCSQWRDHFESHPNCCIQLAELGHLKDVMAASLGILSSNIDMQLLIPIELQDYRVATCLPIPYIVIASGTDTQLQSPKLTKSIPRSTLVAVTMNLFTLGYTVVEVGARGTPSLDIPGTLDLIGQTTIPELVPILLGAHSLLLVEGGLAHLAACVNKSATVLFGPTDPNFLAYPLHTNMVTKRECHPCYFSTPDWYLFCPARLDAVCMRDFSVGSIVESLVLPGGGSL